MPTVGRDDTQRNFEENTVCGRGNERKVIK